MDKIDHFVILTQENNSFDKLYGGWEKVDGLPQDGAQTYQSGQVMDCLLQTVDPLSSPPLTQICSGADARGKTFTSHFGPGPFRLDKYVSPAAVDGEAIRHAFYQERYQINSGAMGRFVVGNDESAGLAMGVWDTRDLPLYEYLHRKSAPNYVISDRFFHAAFGGSFLSHQWMIASRTPVWPDPPQSVRAVVDEAGMPVESRLYRSPSTKNLRDGVVTAQCDDADVPCGDFAVNTVQPPYQPYAPGSTVRLPAQTGPTIGSRMSNNGVSGAWYSQGWSNEAGLQGAPGWTNGSSACTDPQTLPGAVFPYCPNVAFQFHHQAFNYRKAFDPGTVAGGANRRAHLRDYAQFRTLTKRSDRKCHLRDVSFVKFMKGDNEHPAGGGPDPGSRATVRLIRSVTDSACAKDTMIVVIYDENGGAWDHVPPPPTTSGPSDQWGPGTRIPALIVAPGLSRKFSVDSVSHDTTSVTRTLSERYGLKPLGARDRAVSSLSSVWRAR